MYALMDPNGLWSLPPGSNRQPFYTGQPTYVIADPAVNQTNQPIYYQIQPALYAPVSSNKQLRPRLPSDDVFLPGGTFLYNAPQYNYQATTSQIQHLGQHTPAVPQTRKEASYQDRCSSKASSNCGSQASSNSGSPNSNNGSSGHNTSSESFSNPRKLNTILDNFSATSNSNASSSSNSNDQYDSLIYRLFPASLRAAIYDDPPEPEAADSPLKTSSPIYAENESNSLMIDFSNLRKRRGRDITSSSSEKCPRFSQNGISEDLDQCDKILLQSRAHDSAEDAARKREEFLLILEAERERQRKLVLSKHAPKMSCKFCRNNGESSEVFTKHRLHHNEKTVCPILRHYVCRLCNSTGDFAHTIRHCPFNDRKDKIAWKATFLA